MQDMVECKSLDVVETSKQGDSQRMNERNTVPNDFDLTALLSVTSTIVKMQVRPTLVFTTSRLDEDIMELLKVNSKASLMISFYVIITLKKNKKKKKARLKLATPHSLF